MILSSQHVLFTLLMGYLNSFILFLRDLEKNRIQRPRLDNVLYLCVPVELSHIQLFATPWSVASQASLSMEFSRQEYWSGWPFPSPGYLPDPRIEPRSPALQADALLSELPGSPHIRVAAAAAAKSLQSCLTLSDPMDCSLPGSPVHGTFQARALEWGAIAFRVERVLNPI